MFLKKAFRENGFLVTLGNFQLEKSSGFEFFNTERLFLKGILGLAKMFQKHLPRNKSQSQECHVFQEGMIAFGYSEFENLLIA